MTWLRRNPSTAAFDILKISFGTAKSIPALCGTATFACHVGVLSVGACASVTAVTVGRAFCFGQRIWPTPVPTLSVCTPNWSTRVRGSSAGMMSVMYSSGMRNPPDVRTAALMARSTASG